MSRVMRPVKVTRESAARVLRVPRLAGKLKGAVDIEDAIHTRSTAVIGADRWRVKLAHPDGPGCFAIRHMDGAGTVRICFRRDGAAGLCEWRLLAPDDEYVMLNDMLEAPTVQAVFGSATVEYLYVPGAEFV